MYDFIKGTIAACHPDHVTLENSGIGYRIFTPLSLFEKMPKLGTELTLYTQLVVREDSMRLFGFESEKEKQLFITLSDISGIGPKTALSIIGHFSPDQLASHVASANVKAISSVPGIGKKTAERLLVEMKDKLPKGVRLEAEMPHAPISALEEDASRALMSLGYKKNAAESAIKKILQNAKKEPTLSEVLKQALQSK